MSSFVRFGETIDGYSIPVMNEREIRAAAGILFLFMFISLMMIVFKENFTMIKYVIIVFLSDFIIRVFINPRYSPSLILGRLIVGNQAPEYVGAPQKKFAWTIGVALASVMFIHLVVVNGFSPITGITCLVCLVFLFFESAFGICLGCKFYPLFHKEKVQLCPGEVCKVQEKQAIQKTTWPQLLVVVGFVAYVALTSLYFHEDFQEHPRDLFGIAGQTQTK